MENVTRTSKDKNRINASRLESQLRASFSYVTLLIWTFHDGQEPRQTEEDIVYIGFSLIRCCYHLIFRLQLLDSSVFDVVAKQNQQCPSKGTCSICNTFSLHNDDVIISFSRLISACWRTFDVLTPK